MTSRAVMAKRSPEKVDLWTAKIIADKPFRSGNSRHGKQGSAGHLGDAHEETGIPAARVLTAQAVHEMQDVEVMMRK